MNSIITVEVMGKTYTKTFFGREDDIYNEAIDWQNELVNKYIVDHNINDISEIQFVDNTATHTIVFEPEKPIMMYAVYENDCEDPIYGVYATRADAEEAILTECEDWVYETMLCEDPADVIGLDFWDWYVDWRFLMRDAARCFHIQKINVFGFQEEG